MRQNPPGFRRCQARTIRRTGRGIFDDILGKVLVWSRDGLFHGRHPWNLGSTCHFRAKLIEITIGPP
jgi:hypothetical protein